MDKKQFDELIITIINGFNDIKESINDLKLDNKKSNNIKLSDYVGIPLSSVHHPENPEMIGDSRRIWSEDKNMWIRKK